MHNSRKFLYKNSYLSYISLHTKFKQKMNSNKDIFDKALGRPAMMGFMLLMGTYLVTGQLIPGWF